MLKVNTWEPVTFEGAEEPITFEVKRLNFLEEKVFSTKMNRVRRDKLVKHMLIAQAEQRERQTAMLTRMNEALVRGGHQAVPLGDDLDAAHTEVTARLTAAGIVVAEATAGELADLLQQNEVQILERQKDMDEFFESLDEKWLTAVFTNYVRHVQGIESDGAPVSTGAALLEIADQALVLFVLTTIQGFAGLPEKAKKASSSPPISGPVDAIDGGKSVVPPVNPEDGNTPGTAAAMSLVPRSSSAAVAVPI